MATPDLGVSGAVTDPDGTLQVSPDASTLLLDDFSGTLTTNWASGGTVFPSTSSGNVAFTVGTTASASSYMRTFGTFRLQAATYLRAATIVQVEATAVPNSTRWWGYGALQGTPTAAAPVVNGALFLLDPTVGALQAVTYSAGVKTVVATLTRPADGAQHRYEVWYRQSVVYWTVDNVTVASRAFPNLAVATGLNVTAGSFNGSTAPTVAPTLNLSSATVVDHAANNKTLSDGATPWVTQTVKQGQAAAPAAADNPAQVQALVPASTTVTAYAGAANAAVTATLPAPATGLRHHVTGVAFERFATGTLTASATPVNSTASNHAYVSTMPADAANTGSMSKDVRSFPSPLASTAQATATTFTLPAVASIIWRLTVHYYVAP